MNFYGIMSTYKGTVRLVFVSANKATGFNGSLYSIPVTDAAHITKIGTSISSLAALYEQAKAKAAEKPKEEPKSGAAAASTDATAFWTTIKAMGASDPLLMAAVSVYESTKKDEAAFPVLATYAGPLKATVDALRASLVPVRK